jgi:hypothetical protein
MKTPGSWITAALALCAPLAPCTAEAPPGAALQPLRFLVGHCWKGTFADGGATDEHCFSWIYGGKFVRDEHTVHREGTPDAFGESIYLWNAAAGALEYLYIESSGGYSRGTVATDGDALVFPPASYQENGHEQAYRSRWQRVGADAYDVVTEFRAQDRWVPGFMLHMRRSAER